MTAGRIIIIYRDDIDDDDDDDDDDGSCTGRSGVERQWHDGGG